MEWKFKYYDVDLGPDWTAIEQSCEWFRDMKSIPQDPIWHAEGDVQIHTKMVCEALLKDPAFQALTDQEKHIMFVGALMHDIEKRSTTVEEEKDGRICIVAPKHAERGEKTARLLLYKDFDCPYAIREMICKIVKWHGKPLFMQTDKVMINLATQVRLDWLAMFARADINGRICQDAPEQLEKIDYFELLADDLGCLNGPRNFPNDLSEYSYLNSGHASYLEYEPYDESKFEVVMMSAIAGSGKDTYIANHLKGWKVISLDDIRAELKVKPTDKSGNGRVIQLAKERAKEFMRKKENFVWNATNITAQLRMQLIQLFESYGGRVTLVYVEVPYKTLIKQNNKREEVVPQNIIDKMVDKLEPPVREEAWRIITHVN